MEQQEDEHPPKGHPHAEMGGHRQRQRRWRTERQQSLCGHGFSKRAVKPEDFSATPPLKAVGLPLSLSATEHEMAHVDMSRILFARGKPI